MLLEVTMLVAVGSVLSISVSPAEEVSRNSDIAILKIEPVPVSISVRRRLNNENQIHSLWYLSGHFNTL